MIKIVLLNGPPRCGKDTYAQHSRVPIHREKFAEEVKRGTHRAFGLDTAHYTASWFEDCKDEPNDLFWGITPRQAYIAYSEKLMKPLFGKGIFGKKLAAKIRTLPEDSVVVVTDSGFVEEAQVLIDEFGHENAMLINIKRDGCTFENDSRSYIELNVETQKVYNNGTVQELVGTIDELILDFIERGGE